MDSTINCLIASQNHKKGQILYKELVQHGVKVHRFIRTHILAKPMEGTLKRYRPKI